MAEAGLPEPEYRQSGFMLYGTLKNKNWGKAGTSWVATTQDTIQDVAQDKEKLLDFCSTPKSRREIMDYMGLVNRKHFVAHYLKPLLETGRLAMTIPDKPNSKNQKYIKC